MSSADGTEAVIFVHGNPGSGRDWDGLIEPAAAEVGAAFAPTLPGFGRTPVPPGFDVTVGGYARWLGAHLDDRSVERAHLVMHDFGGAFGLAWAAAHPERVASVTLIDTGVLTGYRWHALARIWRTPVAGELFNALTTRRAFALLLGFGQPRPLARAVVDRLFADFPPPARRVALRLYRATSETELSRHADSFRALDPPTLVLWGAHDPYLPVAYAERQRETFPTARVVVLADSGHWPHHDDPTTVHSHLIPFLREASRCATRTAPTPRT